MSGSNTEIIRKSFNEIINENKEVMASGIIDNVFDSLPYIGLIVNAERQIVFYNKVLENMLQIHEISDALGKRPGELMSCIHETEGLDGCGTSYNCSFCGAFKAVRETQSDDKKHSEECRISVVAEENENSLDLRVTCSPLVINDKKFYMVFFEDISEQKRKERLENIFFHDILNTAAGLEALSSYLVTSGNSEDKDYTAELLAKQAKRVAIEIKAQRDLMKAERGELSANVQVIDIKNIIDEALSYLSYIFEAKSIKSIIESSDPNCILRTDSTLLFRVLTNMVKNALEASRRGESIKIAYVKNNSGYSISVSNSDVMSPETKMNIFKRSYSTKGVDRGIGTYSMKLLTERYLKGRIHFDSTESEGTVFTLELPFEI